MVEPRLRQPLLPARGRHLHAPSSGRRVVILHFGDHDPSGRDAADKIEATLREFAPEVEIEFHRMRGDTGADRGVAAADAADQDHGHPRQDLDRRRQRRAGRDRGQRAAGALRGVDRGLHPGRLARRPAGGRAERARCGTIWVLGHSVEVPATEETPRQPFGDYGIEKAAIQDYLLNQARRHGVPATVLQPGHIVGPGWIPINPAGNLDPHIFTRLARGEEVTLPNFGMETLHHVHADDVAQSFLRAMANRSGSIGEAFHVVSPAALTLRGYAERVAGWFGQSANLKFLPWDAWRETVAEESAELTWDHIAHSPNASIAKAQRLLGYQPRFSSLQAIHEAVEALIQKGIIPI